MARLSDSIIYGNLAVTGDLNVRGVTNLVLEPQTEVQAITASQTVINLTSIELLTDKPVITIGGYVDQQEIFDFTVNNATQLTLDSAVGYDTNIYITQYIIKAPVTFN